jgi:ketosteroid isomerase-like protein
LLLIHKITPIKKIKFSPDYQYFMTKFNFPYLKNITIINFKKKLIMKNKILKGELLLVIVSLFLGCNKKKEAPLATVDKDAIKTEIQAMEDAFAAAYNAGNSDDIIYYADDAISFSNEKKPLEGKSAIHESMKQDLSTFPKGAKISFLTKEVHVASDGNQVVEIGGYSVVDSATTKKMSGNFMSLFEKRDGKYICIRDMGNSDMPKPKK